MSPEEDRSAPDRAMVEAEDPDFFVATVSRAELVALQEDAESRGFGTRWSSVDALQRAVAPSPVYLRPFMRERWHGRVVRSYRCLLLFSRPGVGGGLTTFDVAPERLAAVPRLSLDEEARSSVARMFVLALDGVAHVSKD